jgi:hypothetical protein
MPMSVLDAAFNVGHDYPGGAAALASRIDKNPTTFGHELKGTGSAKLGLHDAVKMTLRSQDFRILDAFNRVCGRMAVALPEAMGEDVDDCIQRLGLASGKFGKVTAETCAALADGVITPNEQMVYRRGMAELIQAMHCLDQALDANLKANAPKSAGQSEEVKA